MFINLLVAFLVVSRVNVSIARYNEARNYLTVMNKIERISPNHSGPFNLRDRYQGEDVATRACYDMSRWVSLNNVNIIYQ